MPVKKSRAVRLPTLNAEEQQLLLLALKTAHAFHKQGEKDCRNCSQPDNEVEDRKIEHKRTASGLSALYKKLGGTTDRYVRVTVPGGLA